MPRKKHKGGAKHRVRQKLKKQKQIKKNKRTKKKPINNQLSPCPQTIVRMSPIIVIEYDQSTSTYNMISSSSDLYTVSEGKIEPINEQDEIEIDMILSNDHSNGWCFIMHNKTKNIRGHLDLKTLFMFYKPAWIAGLLVSGFNPHINFLDEKETTNVEEWFHHQTLLADTRLINHTPHHQANVIINDTDDEFQQTNDHQPNTNHSFSTSRNFLSDIDIEDYLRDLEFSTHSNALVTQSNVKKMERRLSKSFQRTERNLIINQTISNQRQLENLCNVAAQPWEVFVKFWYCLKDNQNTDFILTKDTLNNILFIAEAYFCRLKHYSVFRHYAENQKIHINNNNHNHKNNKKQQNSKTFNQFIK
eukprot:179235_1